MSIYWDPNDSLKHVVYAGGFLPVQAYASSWPASDWEKNVHANKSLLNLANINHIWNVFPIQILVDKIADGFGIE